jgi:ATP-binding cassette subfamily B (MDR/TAP) protein 1
VQLCDVTFRYPNRPDAELFSGLNLILEPCKTTALVGPSGSGKSTVVALLQRFYDPNGGRVLLDGHDLRSLNLAWLRSQMALVQQEPVLFFGSIRDNIAYGKEGASLEEIEAAAKLSNAHCFVSELPLAYETEVGERGGQMSGGQKQRLAIARAIIRDPSILLLDEATSALDTESEMVVQQALDRLLEATRRTTLIIAHRLSTVQNADKICVVYNGKVVESGPHRELLAIPGGHYAKLVQCMPS